MENKENTANIQGESVNRLWGEPSKVRRSVLKEFDPLASQSPIATPKKPIPVIAEVIGDDEDIFEDAESSLPTYVCPVNNSASKATPSRRSFGLRESLLIPELKDLRPTQPQNQSFNDTGDLSFMECGENMSQVYNSQLEITASDDSVEFNYNLRKSLLAQENQSFEKNSSSNKTIDFEQNNTQSPNMTAENRVFPHINISGQEQEMPESHEQEIVFVDAEYDETMNATFTEDYDPLGTEVSYSDPLMEQNDSKEVTENETVEAIVCQEPSLSEAEEMANSSSNNLETQLDRTFDGAKELDVNFKAQTVEVAEAGNSSYQSSDGQKQAEGLEVTKFASSLSQSSSNVENQLNKTFDHQSEDVETEPQICLNQTIEELKADSSSLNENNLLDQVEELKTCFVERDLNVEQSVCLNETIEVIKVGGISQILNNIITEQAEGSETSCDEKGLIIQSQSGLNQTVVEADRNSLDVKYLLNQILDQVEGSDLDTKPTVCLNETIEVAKFEHISEKASLQVETQLNQTFEQSKESEKELVIEASIHLNLTKEEAKAEGISLNGKNCNETLDQVEGAEKSLDKGDSIAKSPVCLNETIEVTEAEELSQKSSSVQNQLNQTFEQLEESDGRGFNNKPAICLNTTIEVTKAEEISQKSSSNVRNKLDQTFEQAAASEMSYNKKELVIEPQSCSNQTIEELLQLEGLEKSPDKRGLAIKPRVSLNKTSEDISQKSSNEQNALNETEGSETKLDGRGCDNKPPICLNATIEVTKAEEIPQKSSANLQNQLNQTFEQVEGSETNLDAKGVINEPAICLNTTIEVTEIKNQLNQIFEQSKEPETICDKKYLITESKTCLNQTEVEKPEVSNKSLSVANQTYHQEDNHLDTQSQNFEEPMDVSYSENSFATTKLVDCPSNLISEAVEVTNSEAKIHVSGHDNHLKQNEGSDEPMDISYCENGSSDDTNNAKVSHDSSGQATQIPSSTNNQTFGSEPGNQIDEQRQTSHKGISDSTTVEHDKVCLNKTIEMANVVHLNQTFETDNHLVEQKHKDSVVVNELHKEGELNLTSTKESNQELNQTVSIPKDSTDVRDQSAVTDHSKEEPRHSISGRRSVNFSSVISTDLPINSSYMEDDDEAEKAVQVLAQSMNKTIDAEESAIVEEISSTDDSCNLDATFDGNKCIQVKTKEAVKVKEVEAEESQLKTKSSTEACEIKPRLSYKIECRPDDTCNLDATFDENKCIQEDTKEAVKVKEAVNLQHVAKGEESKPETKSSTEAGEIKPRLSNKIECRPNIRALRNKTQVIQLPTIVKAAELNPEGLKYEAEVKILEELKISEDKLKTEKSRLQEELHELEKDNRKKDQCILEHALEGEVWKSTLAKYRRLSELYEKHLRKQTRELEEQKKSSEGLAKDFASTEMAFSVAMQRYEKAKCIIEAYQKNEEIMKQNLKNAGKAMFELEAKCAAMKDENRRILEEAEKNLAQEKRYLKTSLTKLQSSYRRLEIKAQSLESALSERTKECEALAALCDEMTAGQS